MVQSQPGQTVCETLSQKNLSQKWTGKVAQGDGPEFKPQYCKKKRKEVQNLEQQTGLGHGHGLSGRVPA
jgi:hypothetical protein